MTKVTENRPDFPPALIIFPNNQMEKFKEYIEQYKNASEKQIFREMIVLKNQVSKKVLDYHIKNLEALQKTEGFLGEEQKQRIEMVKKILTTETNIPSRRNMQSLKPETNYINPTSLLLWFLILVSIWGRGYWGGYGYPYFR